MAEGSPFTIKIRVEPVSGAEGEIAAKDALGGILAELKAREAFDPGGEVRFDDLQAHGSSA